MYEDFDFRKKTLPMQQDKCRKRHEQVYSYQFLQLANANFSMYTIYCMHLCHWPIPLFYCRVIGSYVVPIITYRLIRNLWRSSSFTDFQIKCGTQVWPHGLPQEDRGHATASKGSFCHHSSHKVLRNSPQGCGQILLSWQCSVF